MNRKTNNIRIQETLSLKDRLLFDIFACAAKQGSNTNEVTNRMWIMELTFIYF